MEQEIQHPIEGTINYKIMGGKKYRAYKSLNSNGQIFYKIQVKQKNYDNTTTNFYVDIKFKKGTEPKDITDTGVDIIIKKGFQNLFPNKNDKYNPISSIMITDYELVKREEEVKAEAYNDYHNATSDSDVYSSFGEEVSIDENFLE